MNEHLCKTIVHIAKIRKRTVRLGSVRFLTWSVRLGRFDYFGRFGSDGSVILAVPPVPGSRVSQFLQFPVRAVLGPPIWTVHTNAHT